MASEPTQTAGTIVVFGGRSEIGVATAARLAAGHRVVLAARNPQNLDAQRDTLIAAGATDVVGVGFDALDTDSHTALIEDLLTSYGPIDTAIVAFGILGDAKRAETDVAHALQIAQVDYVAQISILTLLASALRTVERPSTLIVFSSVAGVRVRQANYVYGSTKAGLDGFASGLSDSLRSTSVRVLLVRSGFVVGAMTAELMASGVKPAPFSKTPDQVADAVARAYRRGRHEVWVASILRPMFFGMRLLPRPIWRRLPR